MQRLMNLEERSNLPNKEIILLVNEGWRKMSGYGVRVIALSKFLQQNYNLTIIEIARNFPSVKLFQLDSFQPNKVKNEISKRLFIEKCRMSVVLAEGLYPSYFASKFACNFIYDIHGIAMESNIIKKPISLFLEREAYIKAKAVIYVSKSMKEYFERKYKYYKQMFVIIPSFKLKVNCNDIVSTMPAARKELGIPPDKIVVIYSGGLQKWQNIKDVIKLYKFLCKNYKNTLYPLILTPVKNHSFFKNKLKNVPFIKIDYAVGMKLRNYYIAANYGLIPRKCNVINNVAIPTKMVDYLSYGIVPIIRETFSDFRFYDFEYVKIVDLLNGLYKLMPNKKSCYNVKLYNSHFVIENASQKLFDIIETLNQTNIVE